MYSPSLSYWSSTARVALKYRHKLWVIVGYTVDQEGSFVSPVQVAGSGRAAAESRRGSLSGMQLARVASATQARSPTCRKYLGLKTIETHVTDEIGFSLS